MSKSTLLFDEFDVKEHSTIDYLKKGKRAFNNGVIHNAKLSDNSLSGTYKRGNVTRTVKITRMDTKLIGTIDEKPITPFTSPLTALAYWYINYINESKQLATTHAETDNSLEPFNKLQLTLLFDPQNNKVNLTFYQPKTGAFCEESHLFIHTFNQLIGEFDSTTQTLIQKLVQHYDETIFYSKDWLKIEPFLSNHIILLIKNNGIYSKNHQKITIIKDDIHLKTTCKINNHQVITSFDWVTKNNGDIPIHNAMQCDRSDYIVHEDFCYKITNPLHAKMALQFKQSSFQRLDISKIKPFITKMVELRKKIKLELAIDANIQKLKKTPTPPKCIINIKPTKTGGKLEIAYRYNSITIPGTHNSPYLIFDDFTYTERDFDKEHELRDILLHYHPKSTEENAITYESPYFDQIIGELKTKDINDMALSKDTAQTIRLSKAAIQPKIQFKSQGSNHLTLHLDWLDPNKNKLTNAIGEHIHRQKNFFYDSKNNTVIPIENSDILTELSQQSEIKIPVGIGIFIALNTSFEVDLPKNLTTVIKSLKDQKEIELSKETKRLRPFQKDGLQWLLSLYKTEFNGILADDMGLGKTIQSIFLLKEIKKELSSPALIIMPKTLLFNWEKEIKTFAPELSVLVYDGPKRSKTIPEFNNYDVILASYTAIRIDIKTLKDLHFKLIILDEAQYVKNRTTNTFKAIKKLSAEKRLLLTGTPLENNIGDLWSLMDIANNNYFGNYKAFDTFYSEPNHKSILKAAINPFMLRRRKKEVLTDLPTITIQELWASPTPEEIKAYTNFAKKEWQQIETIVQNKGVEKSKIHIFSLMTKLRQWCAHPKLIKETNEAGPKWHIFFDRLCEAIETGHKVVIFSQFIPMIETMEQELNELGIPFISLTGQTKDRASVIEEFNQNNDIRVGIFSLKAGGVGINLTSADYVFLYDPWWNPAVEQQAIDRVHRIGQDQPVMVFKCLVANTIEERMINYQNQKRELIDSLIEEQELNELDISEIKALIGI